MHSSPPTSSRILQVGGIHSFEEEAAKEEHEGAVVAVVRESSGSTRSTSGATTRRKYDAPPPTTRKKALGGGGGSTSMRTTTSASAARPPTPGSWTEFFFGFMYEEEYLDDEDDESYYYHASPVSSNAWTFSSHFHMSLCTMNILWQASEVMTILTVMNTDNNNNIVLSYYSIWGTVVGKFINGHVVDVWGARRTYTCFATLQALVCLLLLLVLPKLFASNNNTANVYDDDGSGVVATGSDVSIRILVFIMEFLYSVAWPCTVVLLATHHRGNTEGRYESGIYMTSLATRFGSLLGIPAVAILLRTTTTTSQYHEDEEEASVSSTADTAHYPGGAVLSLVVAAWFSLLAASICYLHITDAPNQLHAPQNPMDARILYTWFPDQVRGKKPWTFCQLLRCGMFVFQTNVWPSVQHILGKSPLFWIVSVAHTGASLVRTSERLLGSYFVSTTGSGANPNSDEDDGNADGISILAIWHSVGTTLGLLIAGHYFAKQQERGRKYMVSRLYMLSIASCYVLALAAWLRQLVPSDLLQTFQVMAVVALGFGIAVQFYHIPSLVGATFGVDKGLFVSYADGVAYALANVVWNWVHHHSNNNNSTDDHDDDAAAWARAWAAVALLLIVAAVVMVEFMEHYFCRPRHGNGTYETILLA